MHKGFRYFRLLPLLSSVVTGVAFLYVPLGGLVLVGFVPFLFYARKASGLKGRQVVFDCMLAAFAFALFAGGWTLQTVPANWTPLAGPAALSTKIIIWVCFAVCASASIGLLVGLTVAKLRHNFKKLLLVLPFAWTGGEIARSLILALFMYGPGGSLGPNWNFGSYGLAAAATPLVFLSRFFGPFGLTAVAIIINISLYLALRKRYALALGILASMLLLNLAAWGLYQPTSKQISVAAYNLEQEHATAKDWKRLSLPHRDTDLFVLPEYSYFFNYPSNVREMKVHLSPQTILVTSEASSKTRPYTNDLVMYTANGQLKSRQSKTYLAAYGEYMPYATAAYYRATNNASFVDTFVKQNQVRPGSTPEQPVTIHGLTIGGLVCSGVLNLGEYHRLAHQGSDVLTNSASLALLKEAKLYHVQEYYQNRIHAVANAKPFVQSTRSGTAYIMDSDGKILVQTSGTGLIQASVPLQPKRTLFSLL